MAMSFGRVVRKLEARLVPWDGMRLVRPRSCARREGANTLRRSVVSGVRPAVNGAVQCHHLFWLQSRPGQLEQLS